MATWVSRKGKAALGNIEWRKHLRPWGKKVFWKRNRRRARAARHRPAVLQ